MRRWLLLALALLATSPLLSASPDTWAPIAARTLKSIVEVENTQGRCTGFVIDPAHGDKGKTDLIMTAAHCDGDELFADRSPAKVISKDTKHDFLIVEVSDTDRPALSLAATNPLPGDEALSYGYGYGLDRPLLRVAHISDDSTYIPEGGIGGPFLVTDVSFVSGMSGGPVVNAAGEVVMIVQLGNAYVGLGRGAELIKDRVGKYFAKGVQ